MAIKAVFVGINKHLDAAIPELSGARRDATALWVLFSDTVDGLSARLLLDDAATHAEVTEAKHWLRCGRSGSTTYEIASHVAASHGTLGFQVVEKPAEEDGFRLPLTGTCLATSSPRRRRIRATDS